MLHSHLRSDFTSGYIYVYTLQYRVWVRPPVMFEMVSTDMHTLNSIS